MSCKRKFLYLIIWILAGLPVLFLSFNFTAIGQTPISGVINTVSARIDEVWSFNTTPGNIDSVHVNSVSGFTVGDTVLVHMSVGADAYTDPFFQGAISFANNSGKYAFFLLKDIDVVNKYLILNSTLPEFTPLIPGEFGQILKVPTYRKARITSTLTSNPYDTATHTGGILALIVKQGLIFDEDINVDGKGFPGADPDTNHFSGACSSTDILFSKTYLTPSDVNYAALKGYSFTYTTKGLTRGFGALNNGGGGGNGKYSGGGGGANSGNGGNGGFESASCAAIPADIGGRGGKAPKTVYYESVNNRITFGGGGGTSLQNLPDTKATPGGKGGGIVIIICDSLIGNKNIYARGDSVPGFSTSGAGGGGAGGTIILHVNSYTNSPKLWVTGGNGGSVSSLITEARGPGGGGGGGTIWHNGTNLGSLSNASPGIRGTYKQDNYGALNGGPGSVLKNLKIPIRGFVINYIPDADTICNGVKPNTINAAPAVGGAGTLTYKWFQSTDAFNWVVADSSSNDNAIYTPRTVTNTTMYYRRFVTDGFIEDSSNIVKMYVLPVLNNNSIKPDNTSKSDTTVCAMLTAGNLKQLGPMTGGNGIYRYMWEKSPESTFGTRDTVGTSVAYPTPVLTDTVWYRRTVYSGPRNRMESGALNNTCKSTSNTIKIAVLPEISNNILNDDQEICTTRTPVILRANNGEPQGGDNTYIFKWQIKTVSPVWTDISNDSTYQPPALTASQQYRRIVFSGNANTCKDTTSESSGNVFVMPVISNNTLDPIGQNILCAGLPGDTLKASLPSGGNSGYRYYWQKDEVNTAGGNVMSNFIPGILPLNETMIYSFRRIVYSGNNIDSTQQCWSISNERTISILNPVTNNDVSVPKTIWCEGKTPDIITGSAPENGDGTYVYSWISKQIGLDWVEKSELTQNYNPAIITSDISYRRIVKSGLNGTCKDTSNFIALTMHDSIRNNSINSGTTVYVCFDQDSILQATSPGELTGGDGTNYTFLWKQSPDSLGTYSDASHSLNSKSMYQTEPVQANMYFKRYVASGDCDNTSKYMKIEPLPLPFLAELKVSRNEICFSKLDNVISATIQSGLLPYVLSFEDGQGFIDTEIFETVTETIKPQISDPPLDPGFMDYTYKAVSLRDSKECYAKPSALSTALRVYTTPKPEWLGDTTVLSCSDTLQLSIKKSFGLSSWHLGNIYGISAGNTSNFAVDLSASFSADDSASATLAYVEDIANCHSDTIYIDAVLYNFPDPVTDSSIFKVTEGIAVLAGNPVVIYISDKQQFRGRPIVSGIPGWRITGGGGALSDPGSMDVMISELDQENPTKLEYNISNGICPVTPMEITIERHNLRVYQGFSPNGDGLNEELWAIGLADEEVDFKFQLFSSSGSFIKEVTRKDLEDDDYNYGDNMVALWDGTTILGGKGNYVPDGTYYYVLVVTYHAAPFNERGYVIVKR